jgi:diguanylate cyclase
MTVLTSHRILLIDDTPSIHEDFRRILVGTERSTELDEDEETLFGEVSTAAGSVTFELDHAYQGREGLEKVEASLAGHNPYAMAFVDMRMPPGWDGVETIEHIWAADPRLQIVICTAHSDYTWDEVLGRLGAEDRLLILKKPFENIEVAQLASALTAKWEMTRRAEARVSSLQSAVDERAAALEIANNELEKLVHEVTHLAMHDALTGLPNRLLFADRATQALTRIPREGNCPVVLMLDLVRFKEVNDTHGHHHGDLLLAQVARRLVAAVRPNDTVARFGGDEFAILLAEGGADAGTTVATRITKSLESSFDLDGVTISIEASIGIAAVSADHDRPALEELLRKADIAMYKAKIDRSGFTHFVARNDDGTPNRLTSIGELRQAMDCEELVLHYQPKISLDSGELLGVEALVRWHHPTRGLIPPMEFIPLVEGSTLIHRLTTIVVEQALRFCRGWLDQGVRLPVAVNISTHSLFDPDFATNIGNYLTAADVPGELLTIEITESMVMAYPEVAVGILKRLQDMGIRLSVDDYGTGYSSLAYLKDLPVDELKIDRTFIKGLTTDADDAVIVRSATDLGHNLGLSIVAEGIEDEATLAALRTLGVDIAQGFHIGRPMPEDLLRKWILERAKAPSSTPAG